MRRLTFVAVGLLVLATAGLAVAKALEPTRSITPVTGTFTAMTVQAMGKPTSCTTSDGKTLVTARARYSGVAAGDGNLAGPITLDARIVANETDSIGVVDGKLRIQVATGGETAARFTPERGRAASLSDSRRAIRESRTSKLFANFSSGFVPATGFTGGKIGATDGGSAVESRAGEVCSEARPRCPGREAETAGSERDLSRPRGRSTNRSAASNPRNDGSRQRPDCRRTGHLDHGLKTQAENNVRIGPAGSSVATTETRRRR